MLGLRTASYCTENKGTPQKALDNAWHAYMGDPAKTARLNWGVAHVVCLDDMTTHTLRRKSG